MYATYERLLWWFCLFVLGSSLGVITVMVVTKGCDWMQDWFNSTGDKNGDESDRD